MKESSATASLSGSDGDLIDIGLTLPVVLALAAQNQEAEEDQDGRRGGGWRTSAVNLILRRKVDLSATTSVRAAFRTSERTGSFFMRHQGPVEGRVCLLPVVSLRGTNAPSSHTSPFHTSRLGLLNYHWHNIEWRLQITTAFYFASAVWVYEVCQDMFLFGSKKKKN